MIQLQGVYTAMVTPFKNGEVDWENLRNFVEFQVKNGVAGVVPVGTTGESPTLSPAEHLKVIETTVEVVNGRCQVIAGTGANSTAEAIELTREAKAIGADATLQVTPYYNKPTQEGLYRHFSLVADTCKLPVVLYNVPGRTGTAIAPETIARLAKNTNMLAVKEAGGSVERVSEILSLCDIAVMCGDDSLTVPMMSVGAKGVISVASNIIPAELKKMTDACAAGDFASALALHKKYFKLFKTLFIESNPIPVKAAMAMLGQIEEVYRLPLCEMAQGNRDKLESVMRECLSDSFKF